jgi:hypothetical protein
MNQPWQPRGTSVLADYAAHALPAGPGGNAYFLPFLGLEFNAAFVDVPFQQGVVSPPQSIARLAIYARGANEPALCRVTVEALVNGLLVPGMTTVIDLNTFSGSGVVNIDATPPLQLALNDTVSVRLTTIDPTTGVPSLLFARVLVQP